MSAINDLLEQINDQNLKKRLADEIDRLTKTKKFGLVFEEHLPERAVLYDVPIKVGAKVSLRGGSIDVVWVVLAIEGNTAKCLRREAEKPEYFPLGELVCVAAFGEPIYPYLEQIDSICNAHDSDLWHALIEAENYHALQLLEYLYAGKVDCIYIDPPYNTGAKDWKYNNNYVDGNDAYRHSKWLSMMKKRLLLAKRLLNSKDSVLIITIDEKEYLHLGCLLEELFPEARMQMVSSCINPGGVSREGFSRSDEYIFFVMFGKALPIKLELSKEWSSSAIKSNELQGKKAKDIEPGWTSMMRRGNHSRRSERPNTYYPIFVDSLQKTIKVIGEKVPLGQNKAQDIEGLVQVLPIRSDGTQGCWQVSQEELKKRLAQGRIRLGKKTSYGYVVNYLPDGEYKKVLSGEFKVMGYKEDGSLIATKKDENSGNFRIAPTQWKIASHNSSEYGSVLLLKIFLNKRFPFPKSLYAVHDAIRFFVADKANALILDFFAGSGTTLHAVNLLNAEDGGKRRCILVTNNEVSVDEAKILSAQGYQPGDPEWENLGIARHVAWPRTVCSVEGHDVNGNPLKGTYIGSDIPMSDGFKSNVAFFKQGFLDKTSVALGSQFSKLLPVLWMKAGAIGSCPKVDEKLPSMLILPENKFAVLLEESAFSFFEEQLQKYPEIQTVYFVTDYVKSYQAMTRRLLVRTTYQLYRDYLDNFRINQGRF